MRNETLFLGLCLATLLPLGGAAHGQAPAGETTVYEREVFGYARGERPDPFRSLLMSAEMGLRVEQLALTGVVYDPEGERSVAVLSPVGGTRRIRARVGERVGSVRITAIRPRSVDVSIEEFGVARGATLELKTDAMKGGSR